MRFYIFITATLFLVAVSVPTAIAQTYHITDLGTLNGGFESSAKAINAGGTIIGYSNAIDRDYRHAFLYDGAMHDLGTLSGNENFAGGINASGKVVGAATTSGNSTIHAYFYDGTLHDLGTLGGFNSSANDINSSGQIVGNSDTALNDFAHAFSYNGTMHDLGTLGGTFSAANALNDGGKIVGQSTLSGDGVFRAFLYDGAMHDLGTLGGTNSSAFDINAGGNVTGYSDIGDTVHAFLYDGTMHDLGTLGGFSEARAINGGGQIVGDSDVTDGSGVRHAFLYTNGALVDLNTLLDASGTGWTLQLANDINDSGWIVGQGETPDGNFHAYLLTPVPEPLAFKLAAMGSGGWWWIARRKKRQKLPARRQQLRGPMQCSLCPVSALLAAVSMMGSISSTVQAQSFTGLGFVSGFTSESDANAISGDGSTLVGLCLNSSNNPDGFRWTKSTGMVALPTFSTALGTSANGSVIVGSAFGSKGASRWTQPTGWVSLSHLTGGTASSTTAQGVSGDGNVVVGTGGSTLGNQAFRWTQATGITGLGDLPGGTFLSNANGISADGATIVGYSDSGTGGEAFRWTQATGMVGLGFLPTNLSYSFSAAYAASVDGSVIVGQGTAMDGQDPFRWTQATGMVDLGGGAGLALATSADGTIVVGEGESGAFIWDVVHGMRNLQSVLTNDYGLGNSLTGWHLRRGTGLSADGSAIVGWGINPSGNYEGWIVNVPEPSAFLMAALGVVGLFGLRYLIFWFSSTRENVRHAENRPF